jgi:hypothetical protein
MVRQGMDDSQLLVRLQETPEFDEEYGLSLKFLSKALLKAQV